MVKTKDNGMDEKRNDAGLLVCVESILLSVNDHKAVTGTARAFFEDGRDLVFRPGKGIRWSLELTRISGAVAIEGTLDGEVELECDRCLAPFVFSFSIRVREHFLFGSITKEESDEYEVNDGQLDLELVFRDKICLGLPLKLVCSEGCKGLCACCGADLNAGRCGCSPKKIDARLAPLEELKRRMAEGGEA